MFSHVSAFLNPASVTLKTPFGAAVTRILTIRHSVRAVTRIAGCPYTGAGSENSKVLGTVAGVNPESQPSSENHKGGEN
jgi:hypothetical protein